MDQSDAWLRIVLAINTVGTTVVAVLVFFWTRGRNQAIADALLARRVEQIEGDVRATALDILALEKDLKGEHQFRSEQVRVLNVNMGLLQTQVARIEARVDEHGRRLAVK